MTDVEDLLQKLILIYSPSENEKHICEFVWKLLIKNGFKVSKISIDNNGFNIVAKIGKPRIYLSAHLDTVMPNLKLKQTKTHIYGRGACDTKGCVASMLIAVILCKKQNLSDFGLIFTVGEETDFRGIKAIIKSKINIPFVVVGEPTSLQIVNGHFGILSFKIIVKGKAVHSSNPEKGINAIELLINKIFEINKIKIHPESTVSLVKINGGIANNIIPDVAEAVFTFRISPNDKNNYENQFREILDKRTTLENLQETKSIYCKIPKQLSFIKKNKIVRYSTELAFYKKGIVLGPGNIAFAHGTNEQISKMELNNAVEVYQRIIKNFVLG